MEAGGLWLEEMEGGYAGTGGAGFLHAHIEGQGCRAAVVLAYMLAAMP